MQTLYTVSHQSYGGSTDDEGYPTGDAYSNPVDRPVYGWYPLASKMDNSGVYDRRVVTSKVLMVPDVSPYRPRDKVVLPGVEPAASRTFYVSEDVRDYNTGPFGYKPGGEVVLEVVNG